MEQLQLRDKYADDQGVRHTEVVAIASAFRCSPLRWERLSNGVMQLILKLCYRED